MLIRDQDLQQLNSFGIAARAAYFYPFASAGDLQQGLRTGLGPGPLMVLGGGSNILFTRDFPGAVLHNLIPGREVRRLNDREVLVEAGGGENWHELVMWCVEKGFGGIENLSLIPGRVGAAPIQNIGAYGCELADVFAWLEAVELTTGLLRKFTLEDCGFGYRDSVFKRSLRGQFCITKVALRLTSRHHRINTSYGAIRSQLDELGIRAPGIADVSRAVIRIRSSKLPDPAKLGNAGSFFKNPVISQNLYQSLLRSYPNMPSYPEKEGTRKVPAGWLIDTCGWKGRKWGGVGVYDRQALVLVNYGNGTGAEVLELAGQIQASVKERFGIELHPEVNIV